MSVLLDCSFDAIVLTDRRDFIVDFNAHAEKLLGYSKSEVLGQPVSILFPNKEEGMGVNERGRSSSGDHTEEVSLKHKSGQAVPVSWTSRLYEDEQESFVGQLVCLRGRSHAQLLQEWIQSPCHTPGSTRELTKVLEFVVRAALEIVPAAQRGAIHLFDSKTDTLHLAVTSYDYSYSARKSQSYQRGEGIAGWVFLNGQALIVEDAAVDPRYKLKSHPEILPHRAMLCNPIKVKDLIIGVLTMSNLDATGVFSDADRDNITEFLKSTAILIENARHFQAAQREAEDRKLLQEISRNISANNDIEAVLQSVVEGAAQLLGVEMAVAHLVHPATREIQQSFAVPLEMKYLMTAPRMQGGLTEAVMRTEMSIVVQDAQKDARVNQDVKDVGIRSLVGFPLKASNKVIGVLFLNSTSRKFFGERELELVSLLVAQSAVSIENALTIQQSQRRSVLSNALVRVTRKLTEVRDPDDQLAAIWRFVSVDLGAPMFYIALYDDFTDQLTFKIVFDMGKPHPGECRSLAQQEDWGLAGYVVKTKKSLEWFSKEQKLKEVGTLAVRSFKIGRESQTGMIYPLIFQGKAIGVISAQSDQAHAWGETELDAFRTLSHLAAGVLRVGQYITEKQEGRNRLRAAYSASREISAASDPEEALRAIVRLICRVMDAWRACAILIDESNKPSYLASAGFEPNLDLVTSVRPGGVSMTVLKTGQPRFFHNLENARSEIQSKMLEQGVKSAACLPLEHNRENIGVLWVHYSQLHRFSRDEEEVLKLYANQAAIAYENARRLRELERMRGVADDLARVSGLEDVKAQIMRSARLLLSADSAAIWLYDSERGLFIPDESVVDGIPLELWEKFKKKEPQAGKTAHTVLERGWIGVTNLKDFVAYSFLGNSTRHLLSEIDAKSFQGVTLAVGNEVLGVLYVNYRQQRGFREEDRQTLLAFAGRAALALKKAGLVDQVRTARDTAQMLAELTLLGDLKRTLDSIASRTCSVLRCDVVTLYTYDQERDEFHHPPVMVGVRNEEKVIGFGYVARDSVPYRIVVRDEVYLTEDSPNDPVMRGGFTDREEIKSSIGIPLAAAGQKVGVMFANYRNHHRFTTDELNHVSLFAGQAAVAIYNAHLYNHMQERANASHALYRAGRALIESLDLDQILSKIAEQARLLASYKGERAHFANILLVEGTTARFVAGCPQIEMKRIEKEVGETIDWVNGKSGRIGVVGRAINLKRPQRVGNVHEDPDYVVFHPETTSELAVPIVYDNQVIGVINVESKEINAFDKDDERDIESLAAQAALAIENARQFRELKRAKTLVGARTAVAWMGMASSAWRHANQGKAITIKDEIEFLQELLPVKALTKDILERLKKIERLAREISEEPVTAPLSSEESVESVIINDLVQSRLKQLWENEPYNSVDLETVLQLGDSATVRSSREWLRRVLDILIDNAVDAMQGKAQKCLTVMTLMEDDRVKITISDTGTGIPEPIKAKLTSEPIKKPKGSKGQGVGLLMAQTILQAYGGEIQIGSTGINGTTMVIVLPMEK